MTLALRRPADAATSAQGFFRSGRWLRPEDVKRVGCAQSDGRGIQRTIDERARGFLCAPKSSVAGVAGIGERSRAAICCFFGVWRARPAGTGTCSASLVWIRRRAPTPFTDHRRQTRTSNEQKTGQASAKGRKGNTRGTPSPASARKRRRWNPSGGRVSCSRQKPPASLPCQRATRTADVAGHVRAGPSPHASDGVAAEVTAGVSFPKGSLRITTDAEGARSLLGRSARLDGFVPARFGWRFGRSDRRRFAFEKKSANHHGRSWRSKIPQALRRRSRRHSAVSSQRVSRPPAFRLRRGSSGLKAPGDHPPAGWARAPGTSAP